jgi:signal transduction histidine kinase
VLVASCGDWRHDSGPRIDVTRVPPADAGGPEKVDVIEGRVIGGATGYQIVLFARSGAWYVQPFADQPFTQIQSNSNWRSTTHLGTEYAALLVEPGYRPPPVTDSLPGKGGGVIAVALVRGEPVFWLRWWFLLLCVLASLSTLSAFYGYRVHQSARQLKARFEERLAERTRIAQEFHDTLLQGVIGASMQLDTALDRLPDDSEAKPSLEHVLHVMRQVIDDGGNALQRLSSSGGSGSLDLEQAFSRIRQELGDGDQTAFRITVEGRQRLVHPIIRDEVYRIGREALVNVLRRSRAKCIEIEIRYRARHLRLTIRDDGCATDLQVLPSNPEDECGLSGLRERAKAIGARLKVSNSAGSGTEIELIIPGDVAFQPSTGFLRWLAR